MSTGVIILAAGNSSRLGRPKQLLSYKGSTLLSTTIKAASQTAFAPIVLVLGANANEILAAEKDLGVDYTINYNWTAGMSSSIKAGFIKMMELEPQTENIIISVSDQPFTSADIFSLLLNEHLKSRKNIIASRYAQTIGTPVLFNKKYFNDLMSLDGGSGAKHLIRNYKEDVATIPFELGHIDIDTETDYRNLTEAQ